MKLDYSTLISPFPLEIEQIGHIKSPTLREIWNPRVTYAKYNLFLCLLLLDSQSYREKIDGDVTADWFNSLSEDEKENVNMFDYILNSKELQAKYEEALSFFLVEDVIWNVKNNVFITYQKNTDGNKVPYGLISKKIWSDVCDIILQRNGVSRGNTESPLKFKSKLAKEVWELTHPKEKEEKENKNIALPNLISAIATKDESLNMINIWDLTIFNLYDQFKRHQSNTFYDIAAMSVAAWGDEKNKFDSCAWYNNIYEN